jgi:hypothetical protein
MISHNKVHTELILWHNTVEYFDYNMAVDWAIKLIEAGKETENILILASFSKPVENHEIKPYVSAALRDLKLEEKYEKYSLTGNIHFHLEEILENCETRLNLKKLYDLANGNDYDFGLSTFYQLYHEWLNLEEDKPYIVYYQAATLIQSWTSLNWSVMIFRVKPIPSILWASSTKTIFLLPINRLICSVFG